MVAIPAVAFVFLDSHLKEDQLPLALDVQQTLSLPVLELQFVLLVLEIPLATLYLGVL